ncbi:uncharacterized protein MYCFIDRAFT_125511 [Pseudocercospora fijiensis CIRAD86]|uniref:HTH OST-type domain-containing protein n=1 Tax=Pseudocercospora fijiensis (strain CIRAD86) TaxID=383855 RepID=N1Q7S1_PSEFD|nr:uncharacterized protein MYCFIDRAFT_125511 [Pseudocercospora fijiensis CIRAD86]EME88794.1 hypothetical protein MYCFIDRAFT_125511 [Pseudocercospora fijiensis CIRAD86]
MKDGGDHLAVLIDADNVSAKHIAGLLAEVANYGTASVRRIYGDWTSPYMASWRACLLEHSLAPIQQFAYTTGKNATDGAMIIDAMDLLYTGRFSSFCLVSSDSDFTRLASRIREQGISVYGFGNRQNTHRAFIAACNEFVYLDALPLQEQEQNQPPAAASQTPTREPPNAIAMPQGHSLALPVRTAPMRRPIDQAALEGIKNAISGSSAYEEDYANLAEVGTRLVKLSPDLTPRNYGYERLLPFVQASGIVEVKMKLRDPAPAIALVRLKD